jgi:hypothetical protein
MGSITAGYERDLRTKGPNTHYRTIDHSWSPNQSSTKGFAFPILRRTCWMSASDTIRLLGLNKNILVFISQLV